MHELPKKKTTRIEFISSSSNFRSRWLFVLFCATSSNYIADNLCPSSLWLENFAELTVSLLIIIILLLLLPLYTNKNGRDTGRPDLREKVALV